LYPGVNSADGPDILKSSAPETDSMESRICSASSRWRLARAYSRFPGSFSKAACEYSLVV